GAHERDALAPVRHRRRRPPRPRPRRRRRHARRPARPPRALMFVDLLQEHFVHNALVAGGVVAVVGGTIGWFVVTRGASFAVHAISELGFTGAAGALVVGLDPVVGMIGGSLGVGLLLGLLSLRGRERDSAIGASLAFGLGVGVLFVALYRPLVFASVDPEGAEARGLPVRALGVAVFLLLSLATAGAIQVVGALLVLTLVITPAAAAQRLTSRPAAAIGLSVAIAVASAEGGILLSLAQPWPTSFFI